MELNFPLSREQVAAVLRDRGVGLTHQRIEIGFVLFQGKVHLTAEEILSATSVHEASVSKATVYNTLRLFRDKGLVRELFVDAGRVVYDSNTEPHHHRFDLGTGELSDIPADGIEVCGLPQMPDGQRVEGIDIIIRTRALA